MGRDESIARAGFISLLKRHFDVIQTILTAVQIGGLGLLADLIVRRSDLK